VTGSDLPPPTHDIPKPFMGYQSEVNNLDDFPTREYFSGANLVDWFRFEG
jgi:hypothetical protein